MTSIKTLALAALFGLAASTATAAPKSSTPHGPYDAKISVCFVPAQRCVDSIVAAIDGAKTSIYFQAYNFTTPAILKALVDAKKRGVDVQGILDKINEGARYNGAIFVGNGGIPVWFDDHPAIAHNKLIIIDGHLVIGGSYNYSTSAETRNAENVTFTESAEFAAVTTENWKSRQAASTKMEPAAKY